MIKFTVKVMLAKREMTQKQLAELTGIRPPTISMMCLSTIERVQVDYIDRICRVLECQPGDLMEYIPDDQVKPKKY